MPTTNNDAAFFEGIYPERPSYVLIRASRAAAEASSHYADKKHAQAWQISRGFEQPIVTLVEAIANYADIHRERYKVPIGEDCFLGPNVFLPIARGIRALLNGETGDLDCGTVDALIGEIVRANGFPEDVEL